MMAAIEARGLDVSIGSSSHNRLPLLSNVDFTVARGRSAAIIGKSGSGKSTLLSVLGLMRRPDGGRLAVAGVDPLRSSPSVLARLRNGSIGFVFQDYSLLEHLSVLENVMLPFSYGIRVPRRIALASALEVLNLVGLSGLEKRSPKLLSGGEQQRVAIARALVRSPDVVLADEPTGALDVAMGEHVAQTLISATRQRGTSLVVVTHDLDLAARMDDMWELSEGRLARRMDRPPERV
jgi:putative ABC transport system ATP-binding protein